MFFCERTFDRRTKLNYPSVDQLMQGWYMAEHGFDSGMAKAKYQEGKPWDGTTEFVSARAWYDDERDHYSPNPVPKPLGMGATTSRTMSMPTTTRTNASRPRNAAVNSQPRQRQHQSQAPAPARAQAQARAPAQADYEDEDFDNFD